jgi:TupA-like ATPgrasp
MVMSRMLHDRNPLLTTISDKLAARDYIAAKGFGEYLIPLIWKGNDPDQIPFQELPNKCVIKATHGCSYNIVITDKSKIDIESIKSELQPWLHENYCDDFKIGIEWAYKNIQPTILIEEFIGIGVDAPVDYKFYVFNQKVEVCSIHYDRYTEHKTLSVDRNFKPHKFHYHLKMPTFAASPPVNYSKLVLLAEALAADFDFIRVDLYEIAGKIYFGELTPYPGGVSAQFLPKEMDVKFGELWKSGKQLGSRDKILEKTI